MHCFFIIEDEGTGLGTLMGSSNGLCAHLFCQKMEKTRPMRKEMDRKVFTYRQCWHFCFVNSNLIRGLFPTLYFDLAFEQLCLPPGERYELEKREC